MADAVDTLDREKTIEAVECEKESEVKKQSEETFEVNGQYITEQAREAMRVFFLPISSIVRAARSKARSIKRDIRRSQKAA